MTIELETVRCLVPDPCSRNPSKGHALYPATGTDSRSVDGLREVC